MPTDLGIGNLEPFDPCNLSKALDDNGAQRLCKLEVVAVTLEGRDFPVIVVIGDACVQDCVDRGSDAKFMLQSVGVFLMLDSGCRVQC